MSMTEDPNEPELGPASPLFASSWMALFLLLRKEYENHRGMTSGSPEEGLMDATTDVSKNTKRLN